MRRRLLAAFLGLVGLVVVVYTVPLARYLAEVERDRLETALERDAFILAGRAKESLDVTPSAGLPELQPYVDSYSADHADATVVVTDWRGRPAHGGGRILAAANPALHQAALAILSAVPEG